MTVTPRTLRDDAREGKSEVAVLQVVFDLVAGIPVQYMEVGDVQDAGLRKSDDEMIFVD